ncbi:hypothetical protein [Amycolatopsis silviterrae]|uniref:HEAT repeat domain-containing protein n=1 Tax=Amycolatopsis silviterrae TaxID=1656914 RepID=A0ABW5HLI6_9PSEU
MPIAELAAWRRELLSVCDADFDAERYMELADLVDGDEGPEVVHTLIASLRAEDDHGGAHQAAYGALERFPPSDLVSGALLAAADLLALPRDNSGQVLQLITLLAAPRDLDDFRRGSRLLDPDVRQRLGALVRDHEQDEWLAGERSFGTLRLEPST